MFERFTDRSRKVLSFARQEAERLHHDYIGTEHILLGLVKEGSGVAANVLENLEVDLEKVRAEVEKLVRPGPRVVNLGQLPFTPRAKKVLEFAIDEARKLEHNYVGTEHLLLGLLREEQGLAAQVLLNIGVTLESVRDEVVEFLGCAKAAGESLPEPAPEPASVIYARVLPIQLAAAGWNLAPPAPRTEGGWIMRCEKEKAVVNLAFCPCAEANEVLFEVSPNTREPASATSEQMMALIKLVYTAVRKRKGPCPCILISMA